MEKLIAFNIYARTPAGSYHTAVIGDDAKEVYLASDVDALLEKLSNARLNWAMACQCDCKACDGIDEVIRSLMESGR